MVTTPSNLISSDFFDLHIFDGWTGPLHCMAGLAGWVPKNSNLTQVPQLQHLCLGLSFEGQGGISGYGWLKLDESTKIRGLQVSRRQFVLAQLIKGATQLLELMK